MPHLLDEISFETKPCNELIEDEISQSYELFSHHYGLYSHNAPQRAGQRIVFGKKSYQNFRTRPGYHVALAKRENTIIAHAYYLKTSTKVGVAVWVIQLVVHADYRQKGIAKTLLHSIWGFSEYAAWGLATSNPLTIKALETVTFRKVEAGYIQENIEMLEKIAKDVDFAPNPLNPEYQDNTVSVFTDFYPSHENLKSEFAGELDTIFDIDRLKDGYEWLAFTFRSQPLTIQQERLDEMLNISEHIIKDAYARMNRLEHPWARHATQEIDFILDNINIPQTALIADFGCGDGRHLKTLLDHGYKQIKGFEFLQPVVWQAQPELNIEYGDCRNLDLEGRYDLILCVYDVIGSFGNLDDNLNIIKSIHRSLKGGGTTVISVLNGELTRHVATTIKNVRKEPQAALDLPPSNIMQSSGDIFDPAYFLLDDETGIVYRKEKFIGSGGLDAEYLIRDKRYSMDEIAGLLESVGFKITLKRYIRAGKWDEPLEATNPKAKEVLLVAKKVDGRSGT